MIGVYRHVEDQQTDGHHHAANDVFASDRLLLREELAHNERTQRERNRLARPEEQEK